jgi:hypothetical protein
MEIQYDINSPVALQASLWFLTMEDITKSLPDGTFHYAQKRSHAKLEEAIFELSTENQRALMEVTYRKQFKPSAESDIRTVCQNLAMGETHNIDDLFMQTILEDVCHAQIIKFIDATSCEATMTTVCAVCAGSFFRKDNCSKLIAYLKQKSKLAPCTSHPAHKLTKGMLLHWSLESLHIDAEGNQCANVCKHWANALAYNKMLNLVLANNMWIGDVPVALRVLTLPEFLLITRYFPVAYIVKLYPRKKGAQTWASSSSLHSAMWGKVST